MSVPSARPTALYAAYLANAWLRRIVTYVAVVYSFEALGGGRWSGLFYLCLVLPYLASLYAGSVIDASAKRTVLRVTALAAGLLLLLQALVEHGGWFGRGAAHGGVMAGLLGCYGIVTAFAYPAFFAAIPDVVARPAVGRTTVIVNVLGMLCYALGPLAAGALHARLGWPAIFLVLAGVAAAAWALVELIPLPREETPAAAGGSEWARFRELLAYARGHAHLLGLLVAVGVFSGLVVGPLEVLAPLYGQEALHLDKFMAGAFMATGGLGLMLGAAAALPLVGRGPLGLWLCTTGAGGALLMLAVTFVPPGPAFVLLFAGGLLGGVFNSLSVAGLLADAPDALRGRVLGLYTLILGATPAIGGLASGLLVDAAGTVFTLRAICSVVAGTFALLSLALPALRARKP